MKAFGTQCAAIATLVLSTATIACVKNHSATNDIKIGNLIVDDAFVSQATSAVVEGSLSAGCADFNFDDTTKTRCENAFARLTELLNIKTATSGEESGFVFLHAELIKALNSQTGKDYLNALYAALVQTYTVEKPFQLWEFTQSHFKGNTQASLTHIASLFQDTLPTQAQVAWLSNTGEGAPTFVRDVLTEFEYLSKNEFINFYPPGVKSNRGALYHFYIPMYFSSQMKHHFTKRDMAFLAAFLFNARYEFRQIWENSHPNQKVNYKVNGGAAKRKALIQDLIAHLQGPILPFDSTQETGNFEDLYLGYAGALWGLNNTFSIEESSEFRKLFPNNPMGFMKEKFSIIK